MVLLFHGTSEENVAGILREGLRPAEGDPERGVFLSTEPVAGRGGDPVAFAFGWPERHLRNPHRRPGHLVVVELPPEELGLVRSVVTNTEFDIAWQARRIRRESERRLPDGLSVWCLLYWLADSLAERHVPLEPRRVADTLRLRVHRRDPALRDDLTPEQWTRFLDEYLHLMDVRYPDYPTEAALERERARILAAHRVTLPEEIDRDRDSRTCLHCLSGAFQYEYELTTLADHRPYRRFRAALRPGDDQPPPRLWGGPMERPLIDDLAFVLRVVEAHVRPHGREVVERFLRRREGGTSPWTWRDWYAAFPEQTPGLPRAWTADHDRPAPVTPEALRAPDSQVNTTHVPARLVVGTIQVTDGRRLVPGLRPDRRRGETLSSLLRRRARALRAGG
ncbi:hypothetical protein [Streptomyces hainanensis]|uniref:Uncharacterized protein n=1 Tax=Streptomyces hainanensis TaxID=402648 RepID=A0A4R4TUC6_9ACTN|nr:hypothetical protein [Streptomyces hainanensis]TDC80406.1 hypothetical protein E1283_00245 [Streptomyces hainanensis]